MRQMIDSLAGLWTEYERRLCMVNSHKNTIINARNCVMQLNDFMVKNGYTDYCVSIGEKFLTFVENDMKSKWLYRYKGTVSHLNSCLSDIFWSEDFRLCSYSIKSQMLLDLYEKMCNDMDQREYRSSINNPREYALRCIKHLDLYMLENGIGDYSVDVGSSFIECMNTVSKKGKSCFEQTYTHTIARLNSLVNDDPVICYTDRAVDKHPKIWYNRNNQTRRGKSNEVQ